MNNKTLHLTRSALIAAIYVVLTFVANAFGLASGDIQVRFSEALTILPLFTIDAVPGLFVGCILSNTLTGCLPLDTVFGSLATLAGAVGTYMIGKKIGFMKAGFKTSKLNWVKYTGCLPPIIANTLVVPYVLAYVYEVEGAIPVFMLTVGAGEVISCGILGIALMLSLEKYRNIFR